MAGQSMAPLFGRPLCCKPTDVTEEDRMAAVFCGKYVLGLSVSSASDFL